MSAQGGVKQTSGGDGFEPWETSNILDHLPEGPVGTCSHNSVKSLELQTLLQEHFVLQTICHIKISMVHFVMGQLGKIILSWEYFGSYTSKTWEHKNY